MSLGGTAVLCQVLAGTGGVGKTQLAAHYAHQALQEGRADLLVWVTASSRESALTAYAEAMAAILGLPEISEPERLAREFRAWLTPKPAPDGSGCRWLIVLDDITDPADLHGLWPPNHPQGRTLATTRRRDAALGGDNRRTLDIGLFTPQEAAAYLTAKLTAHHLPAPTDEIDGLAGDLGYLPLALSQAAAYIVDLGLTCATYRTRLADRSRHLGDLVPEDNTLPDDQRAPLAATWSLSVEHADQLRPHGLARPLLHLASLLDPNGIPLTVLTSPPALAYLTKHRRLHTKRIHRWKRTRPVTAEEAVQAVRALHRLSLAEHNPHTADQTVRVHGLIQRTTREAQPPDNTLPRTCADALLAAWPAIEHDTDLAQRMRTNTDTLTHHAGTALWKPDAHPVLFRTGGSLGEAGLVHEAHAYFQGLLTTSQRHLGPDHPDTLATRSNLAHWWGEAGDPGGAAEAFADLLTDQLRILGPNHPHTLTTRHNLASCRAEAGDPDGAAEAFADLLTDQLRILGPNHPHTLRTRNNLARCRAEVGDPDGAAEAFADLLTEHLRILGPNHPDTLRTRNNLAAYRGEAGDAGGAAEAFADLLTEHLRILGPNHPHTLTTRHNLAYWQDQQRHVE